MLKKHEKLKILFEKEFNEIVDKKSFHVRHQRLLKIFLTLYILFMRQFIRLLPNLAGNHVSHGLFQLIKRKYCFISI